MKNQTPFQKILSKFRKYATSERDKGDKFERLMQAYLQTDPLYAHSFKNVWLWNDFPGRKDFGGSLGENAVHGSDSDENAAIEIAYFFSQIELV